MKLDRLVARGLVAMTVGFVLSSVGAIPPEKKAARRPNILFILPDQFRNASLACMGDPNAKTPNLDRLAGGGMAFTDCISVYPVCTPYRGMMLTGRYATTTQCVANGVELRSQEVTLAEVLREAGYATGYIGKWHLESHNSAFVPPERRQGFEFWAVRNTGGPHYDSTFCADAPEEIALSGYVPYAQTGIALEYMDKHRDKPFFLVVSYGPPHPEYDPPPEFDTYDTATLRQRRNVPDDSWKLTLSKYLGSVSAVDECVGRLMRGIDKMGIADNTIVVFTSDHGDLMGSHDAIGKNVPYEESINVPFIVRWPASVPKGKRTGCLLSTVDIMPTLLGLAGVEAPKALQGKDLSGAVLGKEGRYPESVLLQRVISGGESSGEWRGVRTARYTYARMRSKPWMLFDNKADPFQLNNLAGTEEGREIQAWLDAELNRRMLEIGDDFASSSEWRKRVAPFASARLGGTGESDASEETMGAVRNRADGRRNARQKQLGVRPKKKQGGKMLTEEKTP